MYLRHRTTRLRADGTASEKLGAAITQAAPDAGLWYRCTLHRSGGSGGRPTRPKEVQGGSTVLKADSCRLHCGAAQLLKRVLEGNQADLAPTRVDLVAELIAGLDLNGSPR